jgi:hypothetical protein
MASPSLSSFHPPVLTPSLFFATGSPNEKKSLREMLAEEAKFNHEDK